MKAILKDELSHLFTPQFHTAIAGQSVRISKDEMTTNWPKYIHSPAAFLYENLDQLRKKFKEAKGDGSSDPVVLDMSQAKTRGKVFSQPTKKQQLQKAIVEFNKKQKKNRDRLSARLKAQQEREKAIEAKAKKAARDKANREKKKVNTASK